MSYKSTVNVLVKFLEIALEVVRAEVSHPMGILLAHFAFPRIVRASL
jgi:hypothetical protein